MKRRPHFAVALLAFICGAGCATLTAQTAPLSPPSSAPATDALISPENRLSHPANDPKWRELFERLAPNKTRQSTFEERRYFPFRKAPVVLQGEIRIIPELGLSLRYLEPEPRILIIDAKGLLMRDETGQERAAPPDSRAQAATSALVNVLRFDFEALKKQFDVYGRYNGATWMLGFAPRDPTFGNLLGVLTVSGEDGALRRIEMIKSPTQRIEILIKDTKEDVLFTGDTVRRFFR